MAIKPTLAGGATPSGGAGIGRKTRADDSAMSTVGRLLKSGNLAKIAYLPPTSEYLLLMGLGEPPPAAAGDCSAGKALKTASWPLGYWLTTL